MCLVHHWGLIWIEGIIERGLNRGQTSAFLTICTKFACLMVGSWRAVIVGTEEANWLKF